MKYAYSHDEEFYTGEYDTPEAAARAGFDSKDDASTIYVGEAITPRPEGLVDAFDIFSKMVEENPEVFPSDWASDWVDDILDWKKKDRFNDLTETLSLAVAAWLDKHDLRPTFFNVVNVTEWRREGDAVRMIEKPKTL